VVCCSSPSTGVGKMTGISSGFNPVGSKAFSEIGSKEANTATTSPA